MVKKKTSEKKAEEDVNNVLLIKKPDAAVSLDRFKSTRTTTPAWTMSPPVCRT